MFTHILRRFTPLLALLLCLLTVNAFAMPVPEHGQLASKLMSKFPPGDAPQIIVGAAKYLFWSLATISLVWTMTTILLRRADFGELFLELIRFIIFTGLFYWLLEKASGEKGFIYNIFDSFKQMGRASGENGGLNGAADGLINTGLDVFYRVIDQAQNTETNDTLILAGMSLVILSALTLVAAQMVLVVIMAWMLAYGGIFLLGFGGARWTSLIAINYYKHAVAVGIALLALLSLMYVGYDFLVGIAKPLIQVNGTAVDYVDLANMFVVALIMAVLGIKLPSLLYTLVTGSPLGLLAGTASMAGTAIITGGSGAIASAGNAMAHRTASRHENHYETAVDAFRNVSPDLQRGDTMYQAMNMAGYGMIAYGQTQNRSEASVFGGPPPANTWNSGASAQQTMQPRQASVQASPSISQISTPDVTAAQGSGNGRQEIQDASLTSTQKRHTGDLARDGAVGMVTEQAGSQQLLDADSIARMTSQASSSMEPVSSGGFQPAALQPPATSTAGAEQSVPSVSKLEAVSTQSAADRGMPSFTAQPQSSPETDGMQQFEMTASGAAPDAASAPSGGFQPAALAPVTTSREGANASVQSLDSTQPFTMQPQSFPEIEGKQQPGKTASDVAPSSASTPSDGVQPAALALPTTLREGTDAPVQSLGSVESSPLNQDVEQTVTRHIKPKIIDQRESGIDPGMIGSNHRADSQASAADMNDEVAAFRDRLPPREDDGGTP
jgi:type IV secretion system protein VirB6/type IV secretion system protein TrbL